MSGDVTTMSELPSTGGGTTTTTTAGGGHGTTGGIAWAGSLVGSQNPNNLGYRYSTPSKRYRLADSNADGTTVDGKRELPSNLQVRFQNRQGEQMETIDLPMNSSVDDLTALLHSLQGKGEDHRVPYSFYAQVATAKNNSKEMTDVEVTSTLADLFQHYTTISTENVLQLTYQPLAVFRVRPVTRCTDTLPGHTEAVLHCQYSPDGKLLATGGGDCVVRFWDVNTATPKYVGNDAHKNHVLATAWSPDGKRFVSADKNGVLIVWDPYDIKRRNKDDDEEGDGKTENDTNGKNATQNNNDTSTTSATTTATTTKKLSKQKTMARQIIKAHKQWITSMAWEPLHTTTTGTCEMVATASKDATVKIWNTRTYAHQRTLAGHTDSVEAVKWGGEGLIYTASRDRTVKVWNATRGILVRTLTGHGHRVNTLALSTEYVLRTGPYDYVKRGSAAVQVFATPQEARQAALEKYQEFQAEHGAERLVSGSDDYTLFLWHPMESKKPIKRLTGHQQAVNHIAFSPDGRYFASASFDKKVKLWNGLSGDFITTLTGHVGAVYQVAWSSDSRFLVTASKDSTAKLWQIPTGKQARETLPGHADEVYALDWSPNGASVATGSKDRTIKIWKH